MRTVYFSTLRMFSILSRLARLGMSPLTVSVPILGALGAGESLTFSQVLVLGLIGLCAHVFGFTLNDLIDYPLDRDHETRRSSPLVSGEISQRTAWLIVFIQPLLIFALYLLGLNGSAAGLALLVGSVTLSVVYNLWSKQGSLPRVLAEIALAVSIGILCLASAAIGDIASPSSMFYAATLTLILLLVNSVSSGLKDLKTDQAHGARSFVLSTGSRMLDDDALTLTLALIRYSAALQIGLLLLFAWLIITLHPPFLIGTLIVILSLYAALHLRMLLSVRSFQGIRRSLPLLNGYYNYAAWALFIADRLPLWAQIVLLLLVASLLSVPFRLFLQTWRSRYDAVS